MIKRCRDMQKLSKGAIYALHRGDHKNALMQLSEAEAMAREELLPLVSAAPRLRHGAFSNACEEWAEGKILAFFLLGEETKQSETGPGAVTPTEGGRILPWSHVSWLLTMDEYLGGLYDFTGELGRLAVMRATERDLTGVTSYLNLLEDLEARLMQLDPGNPGLRKKHGPLKATCDKVQRLVYELSLSQHSALMGARLVAGGGGGAEGGERAQGEAEEEPSARG